MIKAVLGVLCFKLPLTGSSNPAPPAWIALDSSAEAKVAVANLTERETCRGGRFLGCLGLGHLGVVGFWSTREHPMRPPLTAQTMPVPAQAMHFKSATINAVVARIG